MTMRFLDALLNTAAAAGELHPKVRRLNQRTERVGKDIAYTEPGDRAHQLDVYRPCHTNDVLPVVFFVHGGGFRILSKDSHRALARRFADAGYVVVTINYRLTPEGAYPHALQDVLRALIWTLDHAQDFGGDVSRLVYAGESAGGNLTLATALASCFKRPEAWAQEIFERDPSPRVVLPACGILEVHDAQRYVTNKALPRWIRARVKLVCEGYLGAATEQDLLASPLRLLEEGKVPERPLPPMFSICGDRDPILDDTLRLGRALEAHNNVGGISIYPGQHHAFHALFTAQADQAWTDQLEFINAHMPTKNAP